jgi:hypothetical protein
VLPEDPLQYSYVIHLLLTDDVNPYSIGFHVQSFRIPENTQVMPVLVVPGTTGTSHRLAGQVDRIEKVELYCEYLKEVEELSGECVSARILATSICFSYQWCCLRPTRTQGLSLKRVTICYHNKLTNILVRH